jgi:hypothetical protein
MNYAKAYDAEGNLIGEVLIDLPKDKCPVSPEVIKQINETMRQDVMRRIQRHWRSDGLHGG